MQTILITLTIVAALVLILLVGLLPRESQKFFRDSTTSIGKSGYWETHFAKKILVLLASLALIVLMIFFMVQSL
ncbi:accessory secretory protein Asp5 [Streptococcus sp. IsoGale022]|uniref:accessory Sec system protein Asp5 n=1 Tax=Streptococcus sp. IsoGale022 TaxID=2923524 RepID=UPI00280E0215|nr:accessory secretory protein Asp5 [Streptococcus sp. IsoGale022]MDQ8692753.1 accessory secretory protein Asp5 [Streptococcus sp. IsoGale022]